MHQILTWLKKLNNGGWGAKRMGTILFLVFVGVFLWILQKNFILTGSATYEQDFSKLRQQGFSSFFIAPGPEYNLEQKEYYQRLTKSPVKIEFRRPYFASDLELSLVTQPHPHPMVQLGVSSEAYGGRRFQPLDLRVVDDILQSDRFVIFDQDDEVAYLRRLSDEERDDLPKEAKDYESRSPSKQQADKPSARSIPKFANRSEFYAQPLPEYHIGFLNPHATAHTQIPGVLPNPVFQRYDLALRGTHYMKVYVSKRGTIEFRFELSDHNLLEGKDDIKLRLWQVNGETFEQQEMKDDGVTGSKGPETRKGVIDVRKEGLAEGLYLIDLEATTDIWIDAIETTNSIWAFRDRLTMADAQVSTDLTTNRSHLAFVTNRKIGFQTISSGDRQIELTETGDGKELLLGEGFPSIHVPVSDVIATTDGLIALTPTARTLFNVHLLNPIEEWKNLDYLVVGKTWGATVELLKNGQRKLTRSYSFQDISEARNRMTEFWIDIPTLNSSPQEVVVTSVIATVKRRPVSEIFTILFQKIF